MNRADLVRHTALHALADGAPLHEEIEAVVPGHAAGGIARAGDLAGALRAVARNDDERAAFQTIAQHPSRALSLTRSLAALRLPERAPLQAALAYFALVFLVEAGAAAITYRVIAPILGDVANGDGGGGVFRFARIGALLLALLCAILAASVGRLGRAAVARARVRAAEAVAGGREPGHAELAELTEARARAERLLAATRIVGTLLVAAFAIAIALHMYAPITALGGTQ